MCAFFEIGLKGHQKKKRCHSEGPPILTSHTQVMNRPTHSCQNQHWTLTGSALAGVNDPINQEPISGRHAKRKTSFYKMWILKANTTSSVSRLPSLSELAGKSYTRPHPCEIKQPSESVGRGNEQMDVCFLNRLMPSNPSESMRQARANVFTTKTTITQLSIMQHHTHLKTNQLSILHEQVSTDRLSSSYVRMDSFSQHA